MSDEKRSEKDEEEQEKDSIFTNLLDAMDSSPKDNENLTQKAADSAAEPLPQTLFPFAPNISDPNAYPDYQGAKFYIDLRDYDKAINTLINILRDPKATADKSMSSELILDLAKTNPDVLAPLLPYLVLTEGVNDPILEMNIDNAQMYIREPYNAVTAQLKLGIKTYIENYYAQLNTTYIPFVDILSAVGTSIEVIIKVLDLMTKNREVIGKLDYTTQVFAYEPPGALFLCPYCGVEVKKDANFCTKCLNDIFKCAICFRFIKPSELVRCPKCNATAHEQHFLEWVKKTGACPVCQNKLYEQEVAKVACAVCGLEIKSTEKIENLIRCPKCSALSHKDHYISYVKMSKVCPNCKKPVDFKELKKELKK
jgi:hypothetical protein